MPLRSTRPTAALAALALAATCSLQAAPPPAAAAPVFTQAVLASTQDAGDGRGALVRLKLVLPQQYAFTTLTYRVRDPALVAALKPGDRVLFQAARIDGENTVTALRAAPGCDRLHRCD